MLAGAHLNRRSFIPADAAPEKGAATPEKGAATAMPATPAKTVMPATTATPATTAKTATTMTMPATTVTTPAPAKTAAPAKMVPAVAPTSTLPAAASTGGRTSPLPTPLKGSTRSQRLVAAAQATRTAPSASPRRPLLTEHQKEKMREQMHASRAITTYTSMDVSESMLERIDDSQDELGGDEDSPVVPSSAVPSLAASPAKTPLAGILKRKRSTSPSSPSSAGRHSPADDAGSNAAELGSPSKRRVTFQGTGDDEAPATPKPAPRVVPVTPKRSVTAPVAASEYAFAPLASSTVPLDRFVWRLGGGNKRAVIQVMRSRNIHTVGDLARQSMAKLNALSLPGGAAAIVRHLRIMHEEQLAKAPPATATESSPTTDGAAAGNMDLVQSVADVPPPITTVPETEEDDMGVSAATAAPVVNRRLAFAGNLSTLVAQLAAVPASSWQTLSETEKATARDVLAAASDALRN